MTAVLEALRATSFPFACTALGAASVFVMAGKGQGEALKRCMDGFAAGVMLAASIFSLLLPAIERVEGQRCGWMVPAAGVVLGAGALLAAERTADRLLQGSDHSLSRHGRVILAMTLHNLPEGMVTGLAAVMAMEGDPQLVAGAAALSFGIGLQNLPEGAAVSLPLALNGTGRARAFGAGALSGIIEPVGGVLAALAVGWVTGWLPILLCMAAGAMICATVQELLPESTCALDGTLAFFAGFAVMMAMDVGL